MKKKNSTILTGMILVTTILVSCATFSGTIPIDAGGAGITYISPKNADGKKDRLVVPVDLPEIKGLTISGYRFQVIDAAGNPVYGVEVNAEKQKGLAGLFKKASVDIPAEFTWDGKDRQGAWAADGTYTWSVEAWDMKNNRGATPPGDVIVDNTPPTGTLSAPFLFFSPNGDGSQDSFPITHRHFTSEDAWKAVLTDSSGQTVRSFTWSGMPRNVLWDGTNRAGKLLPDGVYRYEISATDKAENSFSTRLEGITIDTAPVFISIMVDRTYFSPNGDGVHDSVLCIPSVRERTDIIESAITVVDSAGRVVAQAEHEGGLLQPFMFNGKDGSGKTLPDGLYYAVFSVLFRNGDNPRVSSEEIILDTTPPQVVFSAGYLLFSPDGDGRKDAITLFQSSSVEKEWVGSINNSRGAEVARVVWEGRTQPVEWDGILRNNEVAPDGVYRYTVSCTDEAGNTTSRSLEGIRIDTRPTPVTILPSATTFSPNGDGRTDDVRFHIEPIIPEGITAWSVFVQTTAGETVRTFRGDGGMIPDMVTWDGRNENGEIGEGRFTARLEMEYEKGNLGVDITKQSILLDISPPEITFDVGLLPFSPDGDGYNDILNIRLAIKDESPVYRWTAEIFDPYDHPFRTFSAPGAPSEGYVLAWNGRSDTGELVQSAEDYTLRISAQDTLGNMGSIEQKVPIDILVLKVGDKLKIVISSIYFKPNTADYLNIEPDKAAKNLQTLDRLAEVLKKYSTYDISLEGHAVRVYWNRVDRWLSEENEVLIPLSIRRAETIREALVQRGISSSRMSTAGFGGYQPVVPHSDIDNRWKNRRVEFILSHR